MYWAEVRLTNGRENSGGATHRGGGSRGSMVHAAVSSRRGLQATSAGTQLRRPQRSPAAAKYERQRRLQWSSAAAAPAPASPALHPGTRVEPAYIGASQLSLPTADSNKSKYEAISCVRKTRLSHSEQEHSRHHFIPAHHLFMRRHISTYVHAQQWLSTFSE